MPQSQELENLRHEVAALKERNAQLELRMQLMARMARPGKIGMCHCGASNDGHWPECVQAPHKFRVAV